MSETDSHEITRLLADWSSGDDRALERLMPLVYDELRRMARRYMRGQPSNHTFQTTDLIHEAFLKLANAGTADFQTRAHFFAVAATAMRHILVDYARSKRSDKRGGGRDRVELSDETAASFGRAGQLLDLDDAMTRLAELDERKSRVVELRFFGGLTNEEIAGVLDVSTETIKRDWRFARNWLLREVVVAD